MDLRLITFSDRRSASEVAARQAGAALQASLDRRGRAGLFVSGGSTPKIMFEMLSDWRLEWPRVTIGLVDERWVSPEDPASNERLVRASLLRADASAAGFLPLREPGSSAAEAAAARNRAYAPHCDPPAFILLGMGSDGHTASWFPGSVSLSSLLDPSSRDVVGLADATGCPVAGDNPVRLTLTRTAVARAEAAVLLIFGEDKLRVLKNAQQSGPEFYPVRAVLDDLAGRMDIIWAP